MNEVFYGMEEYTQNDLDSYQRRISSRINNISRQQGHTERNNTNSFDHNFHNNIIKIDKNEQKSDEDSKIYSIQSPSLFKVKQNQVIH